jgi:ABC-type phosphate transport system auxiliary subunit
MLPPVIKYANRLYVIAVDVRERVQRIQTRMKVVKLRQDIGKLQLTLAKTPEAQQRVTARMQKLDERMQKLNAQLTAARQTPMDRRRLRRPDVRPLPRKKR